MAYNCTERHFLNKDLIDSPAIYYYNETTATKGYISYRQLRNKVKEFSLKLKKLNISKGSKVLIYMPNIKE